MFPQVRQPGNRQPARRTNGVAFLSCLRVFVVNGWLTVSARTRALRHTARLRQNPESFSLLPVVLLFSVSTSGPGAAAPGSQRQKNLRVFVVKNSPQISATTHQRTEISKQIFSKNFANCSLNNATCASTIQGKWRGKEARRACQASNPRLAPPAPIHGGPGRLRPFNCAGV